MSEQKDWRQRVSEEMSDWERTIFNFRCAIKAQDNEIVDLHNQLKQAQAWSRTWKAVAKAYRKDDGLMVAEVERLVGEMVGAGMIMEVAHEQSELGDDVVSMEWHNQRAEEAEERLAAISEHLQMIIVERRKARIEELNPYKTRMLEAGIPEAAFGVMLENLIDLACLEQRTPDNPPSDGGSSCLS